MPRLQSPLRVAIAIGAAILIVTALGYVVWQNVGSTGEDSHKQAATAAKLKPTSQDDLVVPRPVNVDEVAEVGTIIGSLTYPSEHIPEIEIFAENIDTGELASTRKQVKDGRYKYGVGYRLSVPAGRYYVYGVLPDMQDQRAYYNNAVKCDLDGTPYDSCDSRNEKIEVTVEPNGETDDIMIGSWPETCVIPGGKQPTEKFDLPTC